LRDFGRRWDGAAQTFHPDIPRAWDDKEVARVEVPLVQRDRSPRYLTAEQYYALKIRPIYRSYPAYVKGREPARYREWLKQRDPEVIFDASGLRTKEDWIQAGKLVFDYGVSFRPAPAETPPISRLHAPVSPDGTLPPRPRRLSLRRPSERRGGVVACARCHTRVMADGSLVEGAQGSIGFPQPDATLAALREATPESVRRSVDREWRVFGAPWVMGREAFEAENTNDEIIRRLAAARSGVLACQGTSTAHPPHIPSLIGVEDIRYLDATGLGHHRSLGDLMRYAIINEGLDTMAHYGDFEPSTGVEDASFSGEPGTRFSDEQLYALSLYVYSLKPPANPNSVDDRSLRGQRIFQREGCPACHAPPLYTNNKLTPAPGFQVPADILKNEDILNISVGTNPTLALRMRRGTGFYKVPSLRGVWYRNAFGHGGQAETLEEWFDPARLKDDYVPKGFHLGPGAIKGHEFGLKLAPEDRQALIAFLKTLQRRAPPYMTVGGASVALSFTGTCGPSQNGLRSCGVPHRAVHQLGTGCRIGGL
jgi:cytochrome c553